MELFNNVFAIEVGPVEHNIYSNLKDKPKGKEDCRLFVCYKYLKVRTS